MNAENEILGMNEERLGKLGEDLWSVGFMAWGLHYTPLHKIQCGGAPLQLGERAMVLPDFDLQGFQFRVFADVKTKKNVVRFRLANELRHGILRRHYEAYETVSMRARQHCCIALLECFGEKEQNIWSGSLLLQGLDKLGRPSIGIGGTRLSDTCLFPRSRFEIIGQLDPSQVMYPKIGFLEPFKDKVLATLQLISESPKQGCLF